jgi:hypothetical protein
VALRRIVHPQVVADLPDHDLADVSECVALRRESAPKCQLRPRVKLGAFVLYDATSAEDVGA